MSFDGVTLSVDGKRIGSAIRAPAPGRFMRAHPGCFGPLARPGERVEAGATLGLLAMGPILLPVTSPEPGIVLSLAPDGSAGYGATLAEVATIAELQTTGIVT